MITHEDGAQELEVLNTGPPYHTERTIDSARFTRRPAGTSSRTLSITSPPDVRNAAAMIRAILGDASAP